MQRVQEDTEKCQISDFFCKKVANFSMYCMKLCKNIWNWKIKEKIVKKFIKTININESLTIHHWFSLTKFLPFFQNEFIPPTSEGGAFGQNIYPCLVILSQLHTNFPFLPVSKYFFMMAEKTLNGPPILAISIVLSGKKALVSWVLMNI